MTELSAFYHSFLRFQCHFNAIVFLLIKDLISVGSTAGAEQVIQKISKLTGQRKELYQNIKKADRLRQAAKARFAKSNHLR